MLIFFILNIFRRSPFGPGILWMIFAFGYTILSSLSMTTYCFLNNRHFIQLLWVLRCDRQICRDSTLPILEPPPFQNPLLLLENVNSVSQYTTFLSVHLNRTLTWFASQQLHCNPVKVQLTALLRKDICMGWCGSSPPVPCCVHTGWRVGPCPTTPNDKRIIQQQHFFFSLCVPTSTFIPDILSVRRLFKDN